MHASYVVITVLGAFANGYAACLNLAGAASVKLVADKVRVSQKWMIPLGGLLACGALGLLAGFAVPDLGVAAAIGLILYFLCALRAHQRVRDPGIGAAVGFLALAVAALVANLSYHYHLLTAR